MRKMEKPDIVPVVEQEGITLKQRGRCLWACCPFHEEKTASFIVNSILQRYKCFGCGAQGDVIDFVMRLKGISFPDALQYLGIRGDSPVRTNPQEAKRRELVGKFRLWCDDYSKYLCENLRLCNRIDTLIKTPEDLELEGIAEMYQLRDMYLYHLSVLTDETDESRYQLFKEVQYGRKI